MKIKFAVISFSLITFLYFLVLIWIESKTGLRIQLVMLYDFLPILIGLSIISFLLRYFRWHWLLYRVNYSVSFKWGFIAYLTGFAFTASPGKLGELIRIRYFKPLGVTHHQIISAFIFERVLDLVVVLFIASLAVVSFGILSYVFALAVIALILLLVLNPRMIEHVAIYFDKRKWKTTSRFVRIVHQGLKNIKNWINLLDMAVSLALGFLAWTVLSIAFVLLLIHLDITIPIFTAISIYPLSMLSGAASMIPGGVGSTEATTVAILLFYKAPLTIALVAAIGIRISTLWLSVFLGLVSIWIMERRIN